MLFKKNFLRLTTLFLGAIPLFGLVSCSYSVSDIGLVTDAGSIFDRSFNQSAWEGILKVQPQASQSLDAIQPTSHNPASLVNGYSVLVAAGKKYIVCPGFYHSTGIDDFNKEGYDNLIDFILLDAWIDNHNVASVVYETKAAGYLAGYLTSIYLNARKQRNTPGYVDLKIGMWGGGLFPGVTDFMVGIVYGVQQYNLDNPTKKIKFAKFGNHDAYTDAGFESGGGQSKAQFLLNEGAQVLFPVAGPQVADAIGEIQKTSLKNQKVIGVDSDGSVKFATHKSFFITSVIKDLTKSVEGIYHKITGASAPDWANGMGQKSEGTIKNGLTNIVDNSTTGGWDGIDNPQEAYDAATTEEMKAKASAIINQTWTQALEILDSL